MQAAGRVRPLSEALRQKIIPGVTLDEVKAQMKTYLPMVLRGR